MKTMTAAEWEATPADYKTEPCVGYRHVLALDPDTGATVLFPVTVLDGRDETILADRVEALDLVDDPRVGDYVEFADGRYERISEMWGDSVQTSEGGSFYLGRGYVSFSGGLNPSIPRSELYRYTNQSDKFTRAGSCWFFHHDEHRAHNGVEVEIPFRVYSVNGCRERVICPRVGRGEWWSDYVPGVTEPPVRDLTI